MYLVMPTSRINYISDTDLWMPNHYPINTEDLANSQNHRIRCLNVDVVVKFDQWHCSKATEPSAEFQSDCDSQAQIACLRDFFSCHENISQLMSKPEHDFMKASLDWPTDELFSPTNALRGFKCGVMARKTYNHRGIHNCTYCVPRSWTANAQLEVTHHEISTYVWLWPNGNEPGTLLLPCSFVRM